MMSRWYGSPTTLGFLVSLIQQLNSFIAYILASLLKDVNREIGEMKINMYTMLPSDRVSLIVFLRDTTNVIISG